MGWCHEFGPQISDGCDHPMVAGATSCTCAECGAECKGKFAGCVDVWARGPRAVTVRATTARRLEDFINANADEAPPAEPAVAASDGSEDEALLSLVDQLSRRCESLEAKAAEVDAWSERLVAEAARVDALTGVQAEAASTSKAVATIGRHLDQLATRLAPLEKLSGRLESLEGLPARLPPLEKMSARLESLEGLSARLESLEGLPARLESLEVTTRSAPAQAVDRLDTMAKGVKALEGRLAVLEGMAQKVEALDQERGRLAALDKVLAGLVRGREHLAARVDALESVPAPVSGPTFDPAELKELAGRIATLESAPPAEGRLPAGLVKQMGRLVGELATFKGTPERIEAIDGVVTDMVQSLGQLSSKLAALDEVPKRVEALEQASSPSDKVVASLAKRVDRLSTVAAAVKELPQRVAALEQTSTDVAEEAPEAPDRSDALAVGLGHAIDMIDQLAHQVAVLEQAVGPSER
jgi:DNA repair ATPase RecN